MHLDHQMTSRWGQEVEVKAGTKINDLYCLSSRGGLEVEQWSDNRTNSISVDQSLLGACMFIWYQCYVMYILDVCYI